MEDCLRIARGHLHRLLQDSSHIPQVNPQNSWEWNERFPELSQLLGAYFHRDFSYIYESREEALDEYIGQSEAGEREQAVRQLGELLAMVSSDEELRIAATALGSIFCRRRECHCGNGWRRSAVGSTRHRVSPGH